ncbi:MAG: hypothetical protein HKN20_17980 [Gemmatimonadetes bacterium]|nr:hypothetical protein [Gemmatimonadota bacterium]
MIRASIAAVTLLTLGVFAGSAHAQGGCCVLPDNGTGTVDMPPQCSLFGPMLIDNGIPGGTIEIDAELGTYFNINEVAGGGLLGGASATFDAIISLTMTGTGSLNNFNRLISIQVACEFHYAPRTAGDPVQQFAGDVYRIVGTQFGDPDFDILDIQAGSFFVAPSPGITRLTKIGPGATDPFDVESFFDIHYAIHFEGAPGSVLEGFSGTTTSHGVFELCPPGLATDVAGPALPLEAESNWSHVKGLFR